MEADISIDGRINHHVMRNEALTDQQYKDEILRPIVVIYAAGDDFMLMNDNYRTHHAHLLDDFLFEEGIIRMEWSTYSMDRSPIVHAWNILGRRVAGHLSLPQTLLEQKRALSLIATLTPDLKGVQRYFPSRETTPPTKNDFL